MELLLNLAWLLLGLPAYCLWRGARNASADHKFTSVQCLLALGCVLVILFPVISATDDLHAVRAEMEESPASKRSVRQASSEKIAAWKWQNPPAQMERAGLLVINHEAWQPLLDAPSSTLVACANEQAGRSPPV